MNVPREVFDDAERHALAAQACLSTAAAVMDAECFRDDKVTYRLIGRATQLAAHAADLALEISERARAGTLCEVITLTPPARPEEHVQRHIPDEVARRRSRRLHSDQLLTSFARNCTETYFKGYRPGEFLRCYNRWAAEVLAIEAMLEAGA